MSPDERREQILSEAIAFFAEHGIAGTTRELSQRLRVTQPLLYNYFPTKQDLLNAVFERIYSVRLEPRWSRFIVDAKIPLRERMTTFYVEYSSAILTREWVRLFVFAGLQGDDLNRRYIGELSSAIIAPMHAEIVKGIRRKHGAKAKQPTMNDMWVHHGGIFYLGIREYVYGLGAGHNRKKAIVDSVARFLDGFRLS